jgi:acyl carrier protein
VSTTNLAESHAAIRRTIEGVLDVRIGSDLGELDGAARLRVVVALEERFDVCLPADLISEVFTLDDLTWFTASLFSHTKERSP